MCTPDTCAWPVRRFNKDADDLEGNRDFTLPRDDCRTYRPRGGIIFARVRFSTTVFPGDSTDGEDALPNAARALLVRYFRSVYGWISQHAAERNGEKIPLVPHREHLQRTRTGSRRFVPRGIGILHARIDRNSKSVAGVQGVFLYTWNSLTIVWSTFFFF